MKNLTNNLQKQPLIILAMFIVSILSGIMTIFIGWDQFYGDFLSKKIELPVWTFIILTFAAIIIFIFRPKNKRTKPREFETIRGKDFRVQQVILDGKKFVNCKFDGTELVFKGTEGFSLTYNEFLSPPRFMFEGYAGTTITALRELNKTPEFKPSIQNLIEGGK